jgi:toprim domain protein
MIEDNGDKVIIVEGKTDKQKLMQILKEPVEIICTHGTLGIERLEELALTIEDKDVYILVDADEAGMKLRKNLQYELPYAEHLYINKIYKEVARTPLMYLAKILLNAHFEIDQKCLL